MTAFFCAADTFQTVPTAVTPGAFKFVLKMSQVIGMLWQ